MVYNVPENENITIKEVELLSDNWYVLNKVTFDYKQPDGVIHTHGREVYDRGNGATILLYNKENRTIILCRQFRIPSFLNGNASGLLVETCGGLLDGETPEACVLREAKEELGYQLKKTDKVFEAYMSPGSVTEIVHFFVAEYDAAMKVTNGGGLENEQEFIEILEIKFEEALIMIKDGRIRDAKTTMLLQYASLYNLLDI